MSGPFTVGVCLAALSAVCAASVGASLPVDAVLSIVEWPRRATELLGGISVIFYVGMLSCGWGWRANAARLNGRVALGMLLGVVFGNLVIAIASSSTDMWFLLRYEYATISWLLPVATSLPLFFVRAATPQRPTIRSWLMAGATGIAVGLTFYEFVDTDYIPRTWRLFCAIEVGFVVPAFALASTTVQYVKWQRSLAE